MTRLYSITIQGTRRTWNHLVWAKPEHAEEWRRDGIEVDEVLYIVPDLVQSMGLTRPWCWLQKIGLIPMG
jgi:hypothetical protein